MAKQLLRRALTLLALTVAITGINVPGAGINRLANAASELLPDLRMAKLIDVSIDTRSLSGRRLLRFTTDIVNLGRWSLRGRGAAT